TTLFRSENLGENRIKHSYPVKEPGGVFLGSAGSLKMRTAQSPPPKRNNGYYRTANPLFSDKNVPVSFTEKGSRAPYPRHVLQKSTAPRQIQNFCTDHFCRR
ncbi:hypothetical protein, partial [Duodenibacillus massiliensis]|uniref:hypothetical protein n=1 Tax=Duodenibacillus massiliensis TaxID=1852381 RepID=UPI00307B8329